MKILVTGGAGYKGTKLAKALLKKGHKVTIFDNFLHSPESIVDFLTNKNVSIVNRNIIDISPIDLKSFDIIYHLAGLPTYSFCEANPNLARIVNTEVTKKIARSLSSGQVLVYASTTSFYGYSGKVLDENSKCEPRGVYAKTKYEAEKHVMKRKNSISLRFASLYGISNRMRNDLMIHDFIYKAIHDHYLVLYDSRSIRTFLHIDDAISAYMLVPTNLRKMQGEIFNVGTNKMNFSKLDLANKIKKYIDFEIIDNNKLEDKNKRDYVIKYDKIEKMGFKAKVSLNKGIKELIKFYSLI